MKKNILFSFFALLISFIMPKVQALDELDEIRNFAMSNFDPSDYDPDEYDELDNATGQTAVRPKVKTMNPISSGLAQFDISIVSEPGFNAGDATGQVVELFNNIMSFAKVRNSTISSTRSSTTTCSAGGPGSPPPGTPRKPP